MPATGDVTVVMCTRNGLSRGFLDEAMRSVHAQTTAPSEVLLVDDGSTDGTASEVRRAYPGVTVLINAGTGLAAARNTGIRAARSTWIAFIDDDDVWQPTKLSEQLAQIAASEQPESTIWASRIAFIGKCGGTPVPRAAPVQFASWPACLLRCPASPSGVLFSRELFRRVGPLNECISNGAVYEYWIRCLAAGATVRFSENILLHHRRHQAQMTDSFGRPALEFTNESMLLPYLEKIPPALAARFRTAHILRVLFILAMRRGIPSAARFWADTRLQPARLDLRTCAYFVLDAAAARAPHGAEHLLRNAAVRLLLADTTGRRGRHVT
jgi:glycosyltransferase involved in cell wall biosynthesis